MNATTLQVILIVFAVLAMLEAVWVLAAPESYKKFAGWWLRAASHVPTLLPIVLGAIGVVIWGILLLQQPIYHTLVMLVGAFFVVGALLYTDLDAIKRLTDRFLLDRSTRTLRLLGVAILLVGGFILWIAITGK